MTTTPEEAQEAWRNKVKEVIPDPPEGLRTGTLEFHIEKKRESYIQGIEDFKSSLRKSIEERKKEVEECTPPNDFQEARKSGGLQELVKVLKMIDECKPL